MKSYPLQLNLNNLYPENEYLNENSKDTPYTDDEMARMDEENRELFLLARTEDRANSRLALEASLLQENMHLNYTKFSTAMYQHCLVSDA
jgi:hypothetical protein